MYNRPLPPPSARTKVLFAFGMHGATDGQPADRAFFKGAVEPFLESNVVRDGRRAVIIRECVVHGFFPLVPGRMESVVRLMHGPRSRSASRQFKEMFERIRRSQEFQQKTVEQECEDADYGASFPQFHNWGFEEKVAGINTKTPWMVRSVPERQDPGNLIAVYDEEITLGFFRSIADDPEIDRGFKIRILAEGLRKAALADRMRDQTVLDQIADLAACDPDAVMIVPRGFLHFPMASMLDRNRFDVEVRLGTRRIGEGVEPWRIKAIADLYQGRIDERQLRDFLEANYDWEKRASKKPALEK